MYFEKYKILLIWPLAIILKSMQQVFYDCFKTNWIFLNLFEKIKDRLLKKSIKFYLFI